LTQQWQSPHDWLELIEAALRADTGAVRRGGDYDEWDLEVVGGMLGGARLLLAAEDYGEGWQLVRVRSWPKLSEESLVLALLFGILAVMAGLDQAWVAVAALGSIAFLLMIRLLLESGTAIRTLLRALRQVELEKAE